MYASYLPSAMSTKFRFVGFHVISGVIPSECHWPTSVHLKSCERLDLQSRKTTPTASPWRNVFANVEQGICGVQTAPRKTPDFALLVSLSMGRFCGLSVGYGVGDAPPIAPDCRRLLPAGSAPPALLLPAPHALSVVIANAAAAKDKQKVVFRLVIGNEYPPLCAQRLRHAGDGYACFSQALMWCSHHARLQRRRAMRSHGRCGGERLWRYEVVENLLVAADIQHAVLIVRAHTPNERIEGGRRRERIVVVRVGIHFEIRDLAQMRIRVVRRGELREQVLQPSGLHGTAVPILVGRAFRPHHGLVRGDLDGKVVRLGNQLIETDPV